MKWFVLILFTITFFNAQAYEFPEDFIFGVATASYQIEGAWNLSGKGENIWDHTTHNNPGFVIDYSNGDVASDGYHKVAEDVQLMVNVGVDFYRFSLSWSRILPTGYTNQINEDGVRYYNELIDALLANGITPLVTIFHWDLPQPLQEIGGWPNPLLAEIYADYADLVYSLFGDRVKDWVTINEPYQICEEGYGKGVLAPGYAQQGIGGYLCGHTVLLAHARAYHIYDENYREEQQGRVGLVIHGAWAEPESDSEEDIEAADRWVQMNFGWFAHPVFSEEGDYPPVMRQRIDALSAEQGYSSSRLPNFTQEEIESLKASADFLGLNHYGSSLARPQDDWPIVPSHDSDIGTFTYLSEDWEPSAAPWFSVTPWGLRSMLNWVKNEYGNPEVMVTESGFTDSTGTLQDCRRVNYYNYQSATQNLNSILKEQDLPIAFKSNNLLISFLGNAKVKIETYLQSVLEALYEDDCNVTGYTAWSIVDLFEWQYGYTYRFGMHLVDFDDPDRPRTPKMSSYVYQNIIATRAINTSYIPDGFDECEDLGARYRYTK